MNSKYMNRFQQNSSGIPFLPIPGNAIPSVRRFSPMDRTELDCGLVYFLVVVAQIWGYSGCRLPHFKNHSKLFKDWLKSVATG